MCVYTGEYIALANKPTPSSPHHLLSDFLPEQSLICQTLSMASVEGDGDIDLEATQWLFPSFLPSEEIYSTLDHNSRSLYIWYNLRTNQILGFMQGTH